MTSIRIRKQKAGYALILVEKVDGKWRDTGRVATGIKTKKRAEELKRTALDQVKQRALERGGLASSTVRAERCLDVYLASLKRRVESGKAAQSSYDNAATAARLYVRPALGKRLAAELTRADVQRWVDAMAEERGPSTIKKAVGVLRAALRHARRRGLYEGHDLFGRGEIETPAVKRKAKEVLSPDEMRPVLAEVPEELRPYVACALMGGIRPAELVRLMPADVDLRRGIITLRRTKTGHERRVPISKDLRPFVKTALEHAQPDCLFPGPRGQAKHAGKKLPRMLRAAMVRAAAAGHASLVTGWTLKCRRKGCGHSEHSAAFDADRLCPACGFTLWPVGHPRRVRFYDLRHTAATNMISQGVAPGIAATILGHDVSVLMDTYVHQRDVDLAEAAEKMGLPQEQAPVVRKLPRRKRGGRSK